MNEPNRDAFLVEKNPNYHGDTDSTEKTTQEHVKLIKDCHMEPMSAEEIAEVMDVLGNAESMLQVIGPEVIASAFQALRQQRDKITVLEGLL